MTEWFLIKKGLADMLHAKSLAGGIYELRVLGKVPNGEELTHAVIEFCHKCYNVGSTRGPTWGSFVMAMSGPRPPLVITFKATHFSYTIKLH